MLIAGVLAFDASGRIRTLNVGDFPNPRFNGGTPVGDLGSLVIALDGVPDAIIGGIGYLSSGAICVTVGGGGSTVPGGVFTVGGVLEVSFDQAVASHIAGIPLDAAGKVALATPTVPINLSGFDSGFDEEAFA